MKRKGGLGQILLRSFQRTQTHPFPPSKPDSKPASKRSSKNSLKSFRKGTRRRTRVLFLSRMVTGKRSKPTPVPVVPETHGVPTLHPEPAATGEVVGVAAPTASQVPQVAEPAPLTVATPELAPVPVPVVQPPEITARLSPECGLSTQDMMRPNDQMRQSIEAFLMDQRSPHTRRAYGKDLKRFVKFLLSRNHTQGMENLNRTVVIAFKESLLSEKLEHTTVDRHLATLRSFFKWLVDDGLLLRSPADGVRFLSPKRLSTTNGFSDEEVKRVLALPDLHTRTGSLHYAILMVLFYCGLRRSELVGLKTSHLGMERDHRVLRLRGKGNSERIIVVIPPVWNAIRHYFYIANRDMDAEEYLFAPLRNNRTGILRKPLDPSMIFYIVTRYAKLAGIANRVSPHSCRATAISNARDHRVPDRAIQEFAGWASPDMITRYDKRKNAVENSAAHNIFYGSENRSVPSSPLSSAQASSAKSAGSAPALPSPSASPSPYEDTISE